MNTTKNSDNITGKKARIDLGFYMFTPAIGGAERLLRDMLFMIDREKFKITLFYESWPEFDAFLGLDKRPDIKAIPVPIFEIGGHISTHNPAKNFLVTAKDIQQKHFSLLKSMLRPFNALLTYLLLVPNVVILFRAFRKQKPDVLHIINGGYPASISARGAAIAARLAGIPACVMTVCCSPTKRTFPRFIEKKIDRLVYDCVNKFIIPAEPVARLLMDLRGFGPSKISTITWGVPIPKTHLTDSAILDMRRSLKIPDGVKVIGNIARFELRKGHRWLVDAVFMLAKKINNFHLVLVGDGPAKKEVELQVAALGLKDKVTFAGYRTDTNEVTQIFDIFAYPSMLEGLPYSVLEAMAQSKPIVATFADGILEAVSNGKTGFLVPPEDPVALANAMERLLTDPALAESMGKAAFSRFEGRYTIEKMIRDNELLYERLSARNSNEK